MSQLKFTGGEVVRDRGVGVRAVRQAQTSSRCVIHIRVGFGCRLQADTGVHLICKHIKYEFYIGLMEWPRGTHTVINCHPVVSWTGWRVNVCAVPRMDVKRVTCLSAFIVPLSWKHAFVQPVMKEGDHSNPSNSHPFAQPSTIFNVFSSLISSSILNPRVFCLIISVVSQGEIYLWYPFRYYERNVCSYSQRVWGIICCSCLGRGLLPQGKESSKFMYQPFI